MYDKGQTHVIVRGRVVAKIDKIRLETFFAVRRLSSGRKIFLAYATYGIFRKKGCHGAQTPMYRAFAPFFEGATGATRVPPRQPSAPMGRNREKAADERERLVDARILSRIRAITAYFLLLGSC